MQELLNKLFSQIPIFYLILFLKISGYIITLIVGYLIGYYYGQLEIINKLSSLYCTNSPIFSDMFNNTVIP